MLEKLINIKIYKYEKLFSNSMMGILFKVIGMRNRNKYRTFVIK